MKELAGARHDASCWGSEMRRIAGFPFYRQWNGWSCGAEVLRMGVKVVTGHVIPRKEAEEILGCNPDGVCFTKLKTVFRRYGVTVGKTFKPTAANVRQALSEGKYVVIDDDRTYDECHVIMLPGCFTRNLVWCADPMIGLPTLRTYRRVTKSATEAFTVAA